MKLSPIQKYNLIYCLNYFSTRPEHHQIVEILKGILNESQTRDDFKRSILVLSKLSTIEGPSKPFSYYILSHFCLLIDHETFREISRENGPIVPILRPGEHDALLAQLIAQKFLPALTDNEAAYLGYAPSQLRHGKLYAQGDSFMNVQIDKKKARELFMRAFEQGISDEESLFYYAKCLNNCIYRNHDRMDYILKVLVDRGGAFSHSARIMLSPYDQGEIVAPKPFQQLLKEATTATSTIYGASTTHLTGDPRGQALVGFCYHIGLGVEQNIPKAIHFYKLSGDKDTFWDLYFCYKKELENGTINIRDVIEFYQQHISVTSSGDPAASHFFRLNQYKVPAYLIMANIYHEGIKGSVYPNFFKAFEYYSEALKITSSKPYHWAEENKSAQDGINVIQPLIACRDQVLCSLTMLGITTPICNLVAEYVKDFPLEESTRFAKNISEINTTFSCIESKREAEANTVAKMKLPTNPLALSVGDVIDYLVSEEQGTLDLSKVRLKLNRILNDEDFEELLIVISNHDKINTVIFCEPYPHDSDELMNKKLARLLTSIRNNGNITHLILDGQIKMTLNIYGQEDKIERLNLMMTAITNPNLKSLSLPNNSINNGCIITRLEKILATIQQNQKYYASRFV